MSVGVPPGPKSAVRRPAVPTEPIWPLTVDQYHEMARQGILTDDDPVELLEGLLVPKMTKNPAHRTTTWRTRNSLEAIVPGGWYVDSQEPVTLDDSEPEPDAAVIRGHSDDYAHRHPGPQDIGMLAEVADATLDCDRRLKKRVYARARIPVYWIINLIERQIEVYTEPSGPADAPDFARREDFGLADSVPVVLDGREVGRIAVRDLLP